MVYDGCPGRRILSYENFQYTFDYKDTSEDMSLTFCKNGKEKAALWFLHGLNGSAKASAALKSIYESDPASEYADVLLCREISKIERDMLPPKYSYGTSPFAENKIPPKTIG